MLNYKLKNVISIKVSNHVIVNCKKFIPFPLEPNILEFLSLKEWPQAQFRKCFLNISAVGMSENLVGQAVFENYLMEQVLIVFRLKYLGAITSSPGPSVPMALYIKKEVWNSCKCQKLGIQNV